MGTWGCSNKSEADLLIRNAVIYSVDSQFSKQAGMVIRDGKILELGDDAQLLEKYQAKEVLDAGGQFIYPGFIDAHCHFYRYGLGLQTADLVGTTSWQSILDTLVKFSTNVPEGWLIGRGWDQNDWPAQHFPTNEDLNRLFPERPVLLSRIDGHAAIANDRALELAGIKAGDQLTGGTIEVKNGRLTGILIDNAIDLVSSKIPAPTATQMKEALLDAQRNCFAMGLTTVDDCGLDYTEVEFIDSLQKSGDLKMRVYAMLSDSKRNYDYILPKGIIKTPFLNVRSFKVYADGALGSRGACLLHDYADDPGNKGFLLSNPEHFDSVAALLANSPFQMNTHAIGDSGNRTILKIYAKHLEGESDRRWRIEHAQVVHPDDFVLFGAHGIIPSVQPTHATSDMYWAGKRLGAEREKGAYAFKQLMDQNGWIPLGTDFPVEDISPFKTFFAAVARQDAKGYPESGYQPENALSREQALRGMTIWAAKSNFEETEKGSLEPGKLADFILLDRDLLTAPKDSLLSTRVLGTWVGGQKVF
jgi:predicted amidohydrolase YtcJ